MTEGVEKGTTTLLTRGHYKNSGDHLSCNTHLGTSRGQLHRCSRLSHSSPSETRLVLESRQQLHAY